MKRCCASDKLAPASAGDANKRKKSDKVELVDMTPKCCVGKENCIPAPAPAPTPATAPVAVPKKKKAAEMSKKSVAEFVKNNLEASE